MQTEIFDCPYCGSENFIQIDFTAGNDQQFIQDCEMCCQPVEIDLKLSGEEILSFEAKPENL